MIMWYHLTKMAWRQGMYVLIEDVIWAISCPIVSLSKIRARGLLDFYFVVVFYVLFVCLFFNELVLLFFLEWKRRNPFYCYNAKGRAKFCEQNLKRVWEVKNRDFIGGLLCLNMLYCFNQGFCSNKTYLKVIAKRFLYITEPRKNVIR